MPLSHARRAMYNGLSISSYLQKEHSRDPWLVICLLTTRLLRLLSTTRRFKWINRTRWPSAYFTTFCIQNIQTDVTLLNKLAFLFQKYYLRPHCFGHLVYKHNCVRYHSQWPPSYINFCAYYFLIHYVFKKTIFMKYVWWFTAKRTIQENIIRVCSSAMLLVAAHKPVFIRSDVLLTLPSNKYRICKCICFISDKKYLYEFDKIWSTLYVQV